MDYFNRKYIFQPLIFRGLSLVFQEVYGVWIWSGEIDFSSMPTLQPGHIKLLNPPGMPKLCRSTSARAFGAERVVILTMVIVFRPLKGWGLWDPFQMTFLWLFFMGVINYLLITRMALQAYLPQTLKCMVYYGVLILHKIYTCKFSKCRIAMVDHILSLG